MTSTSKIELAQQLFGKKRLEGSNGDNQTYTTTAIAASDSNNGTVNVIFTPDVIGEEDYEDGTDVAGEMPTTVAVKEGDEVIVTMYGGIAKDAVVTGLVGEGDRLSDAVNTVQNVVEEVQAVVNATDQHFWADDSGVHVTNSEQEDFLETPSGPNQLSNANGILLRDGEANMAAFTPSAVSFFDGAGNQAENVTAVFGSAGAIIGKASSDHVEVGTDSLKVLNSSDYAYFVAGDLSDSDGIVRLSEYVRGNGANLDLTVSYPVYSLNTTSVWGTGKGTADNWQFDVSSVSGTRVTIDQTHPIYLPDTAVFRVEYATAEYDQSRVMSFGKQRGRSYFGQFGVDYDGNVRAESIAVESATVGSSRVLTTEDVSFDGQAVIIYPKEAWPDGYMHRLVLTGYGNLRIDVRQGSIWSTERYFVREFMAGDTQSVNLDCAGFVTSSASMVCFNIPLSKPVDSSVQSVSFTNSQFILRGWNNYTHGSSASTAVSPSSVTCVLSGGFVRVRATFSNTTNATNNAPIGINVTGTLTFNAS